MTVKRFQKRNEDFVCGQCGEHVEGNGYTNHCPKCLWSTHLDINPGDRANQCGGMMQPLRVEGSSPHYRIIHRCVRCAVEKKITVSANDSHKAVVALAASRKL